jgi:hypothetical protein
MARLGVNGFGYFFPTKSSSPAGARPGNMENRLDNVVKNGLDIVV